MRSIIIVFPVYLGASTNMVHKNICLTLFFIFGHCGGTVATSPVRSINFWNPRGPVCPRLCAHLGLRLIRRLNPSLDICTCTAVPKLVRITRPFVHGEGPHWDVDTQTLFFVDITSGLINKYDPRTAIVNSAKLVGGPVSLVIPVEGTHAQELIATRGHDVVLVVWNGRNIVLNERRHKENVSVITTVENDTSRSGNRWNDGKADAKGRLWAGTMGPEPEGGNVTPNQGSLYSLEPCNGNVTVQSTPVTISNGIAWNKDNTIMYYIDTTTSRVNAFDFNLEKGSISNPRTVFNFEEKNVKGFPDGMTIDSNENLWIASYGGGQVINIDPRNGNLIRHIAIPTSQVTSVTFGGPNLDILYVTTSRQGMQVPEPMAGSVFAIYGLGAKGLSKANNIVRGSKC